MATATTDKPPCEMTRVELTAEIRATTARVLEIDRVLLWAGAGPATISLMAENRVALAAYRKGLEDLLADAQ